MLCAIEFAAEQRLTDCVLCAIELPAGLQAQGLCALCY